MADLIMTISNGRGPQGPAGADGADGIDGVSTDADNSLSLGTDNRPYFKERTPSELATDYESNANTNKYTDTEKSKLAGLESSKFKGTYVDLTALQTAHPTADAGSYAYVDAGIGEDVQSYIWDNDDNAWVLQTGTGTSETPVSIKSKYESNADTNAFTDADKALVASSLQPSDVLDDDTFATATPTEPPSSESVKAYVAANATTQSFNPFTMMTQGSNEFLCLANVVAYPTLPAVGGNPIVWSILDNATSHGSSFVRGLINVESLYINIVYPPVKTVHTFLFGNDESLINQGVSLGASVGTSFSKLSATRPANSGFRLAGNGTNWTAAGKFASDYILNSFSAGLTTFTLKSDTTSFDAYNVNIAYVGENNYRVKRKWSGLGGSAGLGFYLVDIATNAVVTTPPTTDDYVIITNWGVRTIPLNMRYWDLSTTFGNQILNSSSANFWCLGFFELWMKVIPISPTILRAKWQAKPGSSSYNLKRSTTFTIDSGGTYILTSPTTVYTGTALEFNDTGLTSDTMYYYQLTDQSDVEITQFNTKTLRA